MLKIFISHSWDDNEISGKLSEYLRRDGAEVWIDYARIGAGDSLPKKISDAIDWCDTLVLIWSKSAAESYWVGEEWTCAHVNKKLIIPCMIDKTKLPTILTSRLFIPFSNFEQGYKDLARTLKLSIKKNDGKVETPLKDYVPIKTEIKASEHIEAPGQRAKSDLEKHRRATKPRVEIKFKNMKSKFKAFIISIAVIFSIIASYFFLNYVKEQPSERSMHSKREEARIDTTQLKAPGSVLQDSSQKKIKPSSPKDLHPAKQKIISGNALKEKSLPDTSQKKENLNENPPETLSNAVITLIKFRHEPGVLSENNVKEMLIRHDFFDYYWNKNGKGFSNKFVSKMIDGDSVVLDQASGLMWQQGGSSNNMSYESAQKWIEALNYEGYAGFHDWRLPTLEEAMSLTEPMKLNGNLFIDPKFNQRQSRFWTADLYGSVVAWVVNFTYGYCYHHSFSINFSVRAVRSGQSSKGAFNHLKRNHGGYFFS